MKIKTLAIIVIIIAAGLVAGLVWYFYFGPGAKVVVVMGTSADYPPFEFIAENGSIVGFDVDIAKYIANKYGWTLEIKDIAFEGLIPALQAGEIDMIVAAMTITPGREEVVDFSIPYYNASQGILIRAGEPDITKIEDLYGKKIGVQSGTTGEAWAQENLADKCEIISYPRVYDALMALKAGYIDALILDEPVANYYAETDAEIAKASYVIETGERYGIAVRQGETDFLGKINAALREMFETGYYDQLIAKWFG